MNCSDFLAEIGNYLEEGVAADVRAHLESHLAHCKTCTVLVDSTRKTLKIVTDSESFDIEEVDLKPMTKSIMDRIRTTGDG